MKNPTDEFKQAVVESISVVDASGINVDLLNYLAELNKTEKNRNYQHQYIGTSGMLVHDGADYVATERKRPFSPIPVLMERILLEDRVMGEDINGVVMRPGAVYGLDGNLSGPIPRLNERTFLIGQNDELKIYGKRDKKLGVVHISDAVAAYVLAVEQGVRGKVSISGFLVQYYQL